MMKFEDVGPLQVLVVGFGAEAEFSGTIVDELERLIAGGTIRVIDLRFLTRTDEQTVVELDLEPLEDEEAAGFGTVIDALREAAGDGDNESAADALGPADIARFAEEIPVGESVGILLFEHTWATQLKAAIRGVGGEMIAQGLLTPEAALMVGAEVVAIAEAEATIEFAEAVAGAAMLDAAAAVADAEDIKAAAAIDAVRALIASEIVADTAAAAALEALVEAELVTEAAVQAAAEEVVATAAETEEALDALAEVADAAEPGTAKS